MKKVIVVGGGASGLMAAYAAAARGNCVTLIEKNEKLGKKIYITGKGRCNLTNLCPPDEFLGALVRGGKFFTRAIYSFPPERTVAFFEGHGLPLKTERGNRVFPASDHASDVTKTLERACREEGVTVRLNEQVLEIHTENRTIRGIVTTKGEEVCDALILCTGGLSYPSTGSTGDGYLFAKQLGHTVTECVPSLVGIALAQPLGGAQGISLKNCTLTAERRGKQIYSGFGEMLFTHYGISGPLVLTLSAQINRLPPAEISLFLDFKPALDEKKLEERLLRDFSERKNEQMKNVARGLLPFGLVRPVLAAAKIGETKQANAVTKEERGRLCAVLKRFPLPRVVSLREFDEAVVTSGGVDLKEVDPATMASRLVKGLYLCGEVLDADAYTGGFNLQLAFASGFAAGNSIF